MVGIRYLLDENVDPLFRAEMLTRELSATVWRIGMPGAPPMKMNTAIEWPSCP